MIQIPTLIGTDDERAVSPVIGVILMVAITVILAAVIAAFVLDLGGSVSEEAQAGVDLDFDESDEELSIQVTSLGNSDYVTFGGVAGEFTEQDVYTDVDGTDVDDLSEHQMTVGDSITLDSENIDDDVEGTVTAIAVITEDDTRTQVSTVDVDITN